jgi:gliding motility-associated-like protein
MHLLRIWLLGLLSFLATSATAQYWMQKGGSSSVDEAYDVSVDGSGNAYATGYFTGSATFGTTTLNSSGSSDIFIAKINNTGSYVWAIKAGGTASDRGLSIQTDNAGNVYVTGFFNGSATFGTTTITSSGQQDVFIAKYNTSGALQWVTRAGGSLADIGNGIDVDASGNVYITGEFRGTSTFGTTTLTSLSGSTDVFTAKLNSSGTILWVEQGAGPFGDRGLDIGVDNAGNAYVTGQFSDTITFDNVHNNTMFNAIFVIKYNSSGVEQWFKMAGGASLNIANAIAVDGAGNAYITGDFEGNLTFFNNTNTLLNNTYAYGVFVTKYTSSGSIAWARKSGSDSEISSKGIELDNGSSAYITGGFECSFNEYTDAYAEAVFNSVGGEDSYVSKFSSSGVWQWARQIGSKQQDFGRGIGVSGSGNAHIAGSFKGSLNVPTSSNFNSSNLNNWTDNSCNGNSPYCGDADYGQYHSISSQGNFDALIANCFDPNRSPYDYYKRSGNNCVRNIQMGCIGNNCPDTLYSCTNVMAQAVSNICPNIGPNLVYDWSNNSSSIQTFFGTEGYKWVDFTTADGCFTDRDSIYVEIYDGPATPLVMDNKGVNPVPTAYPFKVDLCVPDSVILSAHSFSVDSFYWTGPQFPFQQIYNDSITIWQTGTYTFTVIDENGCENMTQITVEFFNALDSFDLQALVDDTVYICDNETFEIILYDAVDNPTAQPICFTDSQPYISTIFNYTPPSWNATISCQTIIEVVPEDTGWFHFDITLYRMIPCDTDTFFLSDSVYVVPLPSPEVTAFVMQIEGSDYFCPGDTVTLTAVGATNIVWSGPSAMGSTSTSIDVFLAGNYEVSATVYDTNQYGCTDSLTITASKQVQQKPQPQVSSSTSVICPGDSVWLTVANSGATEGFFWEGPNGTIASDSNAIAVSDAGTYYCTVNDSDSCGLVSNTIELIQYNTPSLIGSDLIICEGETLTINVVSSAGSLIEWLPPLSGNGLSQTVTEPGVYACQITSCGIVTTATIEVFPSYVESEITPMGVLCLDSFIVLQGSPGMETYEWNSTAQQTDSIIITEPGTYILTTTDSNGCSKVSDPVTIEITQEPTVIGLDGYPVFCYDDSITLYGNEDMVSYLWIPGGDTTQNIVRYEEGRFTLQTIDTNGCRGLSEPLDVTIPDTTARFTITGDSAFCEGDSVLFRSNRGGMAEYIWLPDSAGGRTRVFYETGSYHLFTIDTFGCEAWSEPVDIYVQENNIEKPLGRDTTICIGDFASLFTTVNVGMPLWSNRPYGSVIYEGNYFDTPELFDDQTYYVWSDFKLCRGDTAAIHVRLKDCFSVIDPNIFSPNGDGRNDLFTLSLEEITCLELVVYNRWGVKLYEGQGIDAGWNGINQNNDRPAEEGTYYYLAHYCRKDGVEGQVKGYITLIR